MSESTLISDRVVARSQDSWLEIVERQVRTTKFGSVQIVIHDGRVVQIETSVKVRFDKAP